MRLKRRSARERNWRWRFCLHRSHALRLRCIRERNYQGECRVHGGCYEGAECPQPWQLSWWTVRWHESWRELREIWETSRHRR